MGIASLNKGNNVSKLWITIGLIALLAVGAFAYYRSTPGKYDEFAKCLSANGAVMYGAFWCPHCKDQKAAFGKSFQYITYIECAEPNNPNIQTAACRDAKISSYPTWEFVDKTQQSGKLSMEYLAQKTGCALPE